ncbi:hypothetical protein BpHYR1_054497, partial [Brachionus plicatilis]
NLAHSRPFYKITVALLCSLLLLQFLNVRFIREIAFFKNDLRIYVLLNLEEFIRKNLEKSKMDMFI